MAQQERRSPEWVLDELYRTGRRLMDARLRERAHGPSSIEATAGDNPPAYEDPDRQNDAVRDVRRLRDRFHRLADEFTDRIAEQ